MDSKTWITREDVAAKFKVHPKTVDRWASAGKFQAYELREGRRRTVVFERKEINAVYAETRQAATIPRPIPSAK
jgi:hypothetical protein